eukprot:EG_transcript_34627
MSLTIIEGDICSASQKALAHQTKCCNKLSTAGVAKAIFDRWPEVNFYAEKARNAESGGDLFNDPGHVHVRLARDGKVIINLNGQNEQGRVEQGMSLAKSQAQRAAWFQQCLENVPAALAMACGPVPDEIAFPYKIGCDRAGGVWTDYERMLLEFQQRTGIRVILYRLAETNAREGKGK